MVGGEGKKLALEDRVIVPLITPINPDGFLEMDAVKALCSHVSVAGINALILIGRTGGMEYANNATRFSMTEAVKQHFDGKILLCVGSSATTAWSNWGPYVGKSRVMDNITWARHLEVDGIVVPSLFYSPETHDDVPEDHTIEIYFADVVKKAKEANLPVMLYNNPAMTGMHIPLWLVAELAADEWVIGIKDSSGDMDYFSGLMDIKSGNGWFMVYQGDESRIAGSIAMGADGAVPSIANVFPRLLADFVGSPTARMQEKVNILGDAVYCGREKHYKMVAGITYALGLNGVYKSPDYLKQSALTPEEKSNIEACVGSFFLPDPDEQDGCCKVEELQ